MSLSGLLKPGALSRGRHRWPGRRTQLQIKQLVLQLLVDDRIPLIDGSLLLIQVFLQLQRPYKRLVVGQYASLFTEQIQIGADGRARRLVALHLGNASSRSAGPQASSADRYQQVSMAASH